MKERLPPSLADLYSATPMGALLRYIQSYKLLTTTKNVGAPNLWDSSMPFTMTSSKFTFICSSHEPFELCWIVLLWSLESLHDFLVQDFWVLRLAAQSCTAVKPGKSSQLSGSRLLGASTGRSVLYCCETWNSNSLQLLSNNWDMWTKSSPATGVTSKHSWANGPSNSLPEATWVAVITKYPTVCIHLLALFLAISNLV